VLPFPVSLGARRKKAVPSICAERRPGPARAPSRCHGHCQCPATRMWTPRARPAGAAAPGPVTVSESFRLRLRPRFLQVQVIEILFNRDRHWHSVAPSPTRSHWQPQAESLARDKAHWHPPAGRGVRMIARPKGPGPGYVPQALGLGVQRLRP